MKALIVLAGILTVAQPALADTVCRPLAELNKAVQYCDENFDYYDAAKACKEMYLKDAKVLQEKIKKDLDAQAKLLAAGPQKQKMVESGLVLARTLDDLNYLIEYGKQVHSEIEDYVYELVLPAFDEKEGKADLNDPKVKAEFMKRECYGGPASDMEALEQEIRPVVADLEKAKEQAEQLQLLTKQNEGNLGSVGSEGMASTGKQKAPEQKVVPGKKSKHQQSDITGTEENKKKQKAQP